MGGVFLKGDVGQIAGVVGAGKKPKPTPALKPGDVVRWEGGDGTITAVELAAIPSRSVVRVKVDDGYATPYEFAIPLTMILASCRIYLRWDVDDERRAEPKMKDCEAAP